MVATTSQLFSCCHNDAEQVLVFQFESYFDQCGDDQVALIIAKISFLSLSEVLPEHHRDPQAKREASQNLGSSPVVVRLYETLKIFRTP